MLSIRDNTTSYESAILVLEKLFLYDVPNLLLINFWIFENSYIIYDAEYVIPEPRKYGE